MHVPAAKSSFDSHPAPCMSLTKPPGSAKPLPSIRVHDAALDKPPQKMDFSWRERKRLGIRQYWCGMDVHESSHKIDWAEK